MKILRMNKLQIGALIALVIVLIIGMCLALHACRNSETPTPTEEETSTMTAETSTTTTTEVTTTSTTATETTTTSTTTTTTTEETTTSVTTTAETTTVIETEAPPTEAPTEAQTVTETVPPAETDAPAEAVAPTYIGGILVVNKTYPLPSNYNPGLDPTCKAQFDTLAAAAAADGLNIYLSSGFRSYDYQAKIYNNYVNWYGQEKTDTLSARPGHSEHQTGLAIDVNTINDSFIGTPEAIWLAEHAHEYGFIIRYPKGKEHITGYKYEPWHIRYLGVETATAVYNSGLTLEEYLGITSCYAY